MKKKLFIFLLISITSIFVSSFAFAQNEASLDQIVAVVNDDVITRSELNTALTRIKSQINQDHLTISSGSSLTKQVLDQLINKKLQLQTAHQLGVEISDAEISKAIETVAKQNHTTVKDLYQRLGQEKMSVVEYKNEIREQMTLHKLQQQEVAGKVNITPDELKNFAQSHSWKSSGAKEYRLQDIIVPLSETPSSEEVMAAKKEASTVMLKLKSQSLQTVVHEKFGKLALQSSDLGWRKLSEIPSAFADQVTQMHASEVAGPIRTSNGFHIIRLMNVHSLRDEAEAAPDQKQIENLLLQKKFDEALQNWVSRLRDQAYVDIKLDQHELS